MNCKYCGSERFVGHQIVRMDVLVCGASGNFLDNMPGGAEASIYDSETPYGPFQCCGCGAEYDELQEGTEPSSGPVKGWEAF